MKNKLLSDAEAEQILAGCDEIDRTAVNYAQAVDPAVMSDCKDVYSILQSRNGVSGCIPKVALHTPCMVVMGILG